MATINKKWGTVIGCWCVALVMIITGVCLGLVIPSSAAEDAVAVVTCGDTVEYFTDITKVQDYVGKLTTSKESPAVVKLLKDIHTDQDVGVGAIHEGSDMQAHYVVFDLAGHILQSDNQIVLGCALGGSFTVMDSNPTVTRYAVRHRDSNGVVSYEFFDSDDLPKGTSSADVIQGGVVTGKNVLFNSFYGGHDLTINGGNFLGTGHIEASGWGTDFEMTEEDEQKYIDMLGFVPSGSIIINGGLMQLYETDYEGLTGNYGIRMLYNGNLEINGGSIFGKVAYLDSITEAVVDVDLTNPQTDKVKINTNIRMEETEINGVKVYTAVDATTGEPIVPDVPAATEQPANDNNNLIGLIILGTAAAVMVVGVIVIIIVNAKRRNKKVA